MKTLAELKTFCEGYLKGNDEPDITDDWVVWGGYDINFCGKEYAQGVGSNQLQVDAYPQRWAMQLPAPIHSFIIS
jgi:hypothetical protein